MISIEMILEAVTKEVEMQAAPNSALVALLHVAANAPAANDDTEPGTRWCYSVP